MRIIQRTGPSAYMSAPFLLAGLALAMGQVDTVHAFSIDSGNPDLTMSLDTTVRFNNGWRVSGRDKNLANNVNVDEGNYLFDKGDTILSRLDLFSEFDLNWKNQYGLRLSGAAWYDNNFPDKSESAPGLEAQANYRNNRFSSVVNRYYSGPSAEFRDYFVWGNFNIGSTDLNVRAGSFAWLPGEYLLGNGSSISYSMSPNDGLLSDLSPGASAKETALPIGQVATTWQLIPELSVMLQYTYEFEPSRVSEGGTYFAVADGQLRGPDYLAPNVARHSPKEGDNGDVAVGLRWSPEWASDSSFGLWYRKFDDKNASWANQVVIRNPTAPYARAVYAKDIELYGLTWNGVWQSVGIGAEVNYRKNMPLNSTGQFIAVGRPEPGNLDGARGETVHALLSGAITINQNALFDSGAIAAQLDYTHLVKVTDNEQFFNASDSEGGSVAGRCANKELLRNCSTKNAASVGVNFTPVWQQVLPSIDLSFPMFVNYGLYGNPAANNAGIAPEDSYLIKVGPRLEYFAGTMKHQFDLAYTARGGRTGHIGGADAYSGLANLHDRDTLILTYQTAF
ncbi:uncharacterized protein DUF1302 [Pseudomonas sp. SJZ103]|uniref:DUF1302 domain-containing protein n=1 Tax=unclassified Pseudomonas TaxID=196821 RepID=UPI0011AADB82|nr:MULTISPECIES: DUF1302 family protein [unclassified Pseudomonas]MBB6291724.1 hypothetical protein [Pseudomonas sp. SJZ073]MBB6316697.1 hypothetical protein [Pseudomonas sp. JAI120]TWC59560.1 uncharacterized protein DUF1302 [Pseudomonas sp. SJZ103]TWC76473.1 uncharacterized protein DUF1302 [Pseudomonas sp. SJZ094]